MNRELEKKMSELSTPKRRNIEIPAGKYSKFIVRDIHHMHVCLSSTAVKRPMRFSFYLVGFRLILSGNMGKDVKNN